MSTTTQKPLIIKTKQEMRKWSRQMKQQNKTIGLVPTMGYLHQGHLSLISESQKHTHLTVVSIYINPSQFAANEDLGTYPSDFEGDIEKLREFGNGVDVVFNPYNLYDYGGEGVEGGHETWVRVEGLEKGMCGTSRPVFFRGVATVVAKLFNIVEPDVAVFGKKDYQQWRVIERMVRDLDFGVEVIGSELVREEDGLAMSSRNVRLSPQDREQALSISRSLFEAKSAAEKGKLVCSDLRRSVIEKIEAAGGKVDYVEIVDQKCLEAVEEIKNGVVVCVAAWFGKVRLIDNIEIDVS
ncbi:pantoate--beta-alanine ligase [Artemisia annua]|uniref:Pantoate--beta-alanine ligase n=1 Tax=Artemisia annua TaxID=35608 RepID=A0A2U1PBI2_ARTAN|nr:pantoate--beta-alanine ligase [Artemisia annua]